MSIKILFRYLIKNPVYSVVSILTLAIGIGATTAIVSSVNSIFLTPLFGTATDRVHLIVQTPPDGDLSRPHFEGVVPPVLEALRGHEDFFSQLSWFSIEGLPYRRGGLIETVYGAYISPNFFRLWNTRPLLGRLLVETDRTPLNNADTPAKAGNIVISHIAWTKFFNQDPAIIGKPFLLNHLEFSIIGVMPKRFQFPSGQGTMFWIAVEDPISTHTIAKSPDIKILAQLKPNTTASSLNTLLDSIVDRLLQNPAYQRNYRPRWTSEQNRIKLSTIPLREYFFGRLEPVKSVYAVLFATICVVILIVCANLASLTLVRNEERKRALAIQIALGSSQRQVLLQLVIECLFLSLAGGLLGLIVTHFGIHLFSHLTPPGTPRIQSIQIDTQALFFACTISLIVGIAFGIIPGLSASRAKPINYLKTSNSNTPLSFTKNKLTSSLVIIEVSLVVLLLISTGLMIRTVSNKLTAEHGYETKNLLAVQIQLPNENDIREGQSHVKERKLADIYERLSSLPEIDSVGIKKWISIQRFSIDGQGRDIEASVIGFSHGKADLFQTLKATWIQGRSLTGTDVSRTSSRELNHSDEMGAIVINETMAKRCWPNQSAIGRTFRSSHEKINRSFRVKGVIGSMGPSEYQSPTVYLPISEFYQAENNPEFMIRSRSNPSAVIPLIREQLSLADSNMRVPRIDIVEQKILENTVTQRSLMNYLIAFSGFGVFLAMLGIHGIVAYTTTQRTREIGIRMAIGASRTKVMTMILRQGMGLVIIGVSIGTLSSFWLTRFLEQLLFRVQPTDPIVILTTITAVGMAGMMACLFPAIRASSMIPIQAIRSV